MQGRRAEEDGARLLWPLYTATFLIRFSFSVMIMVFPLYLQSLDRFLYGLVWAASPAAEFFTVIFVGAIIDRYGRKPVLMSGLALGTLMMFFIALTRDPLAIGVFNAFHGISAGAILASSLALATDYAPAHLRGREMGTFDGANLSGWGAGFLLGGLINQTFASDLYAGFLIAGAVGALGFAYAQLAVSEPAKTEYTVKQLSARHILSALGRRSVLYLTMPWLMIYAMIGAGLAFAGLEGANLEIPAWMVGAGMAGLCVLLVSTQRFFGRLSDRYGRMPLMLTGALGILGLVVSGVAVSIVGVPTIEDIKVNSLVWGPFLGLLALLTFMAFAFAPAALASLGDVARRRQHGVTMSVYSMVISAGMVMGVPTSGAVLNAYGLTGMLGLFGACVGLMFVFIGLRHFDRKQDAAEEEE
ncbi:MAG: MFS transporter [Thermoplasmatota archaeon]